MNSNSDKVPGMCAQKQNQATILVVTDKPSTLAAVRAILQDHGYIVRSAASGRESLDCARQGRPDLIVIDGTEPGSDGLENWRRMYADAALQPVPMIVMVSKPSRRTLEAACGPTASDFILQPVNPLELLARIDLLLKPVAEKKIEVQKLKSVLETAGGVCHSLNQPLQYVLGAVQILMLDMSPEDKMFRSLDTIREKVEQMGIITRKLAEVTRCRGDVTSD